MAMRPLTALQDIAENTEMELQKGQGKEEDCVVSCSQTQHTEKELVFLSASKYFEM